MTKYEAHVILNEVREGVLHPESVIVKALVVTGDIYARCTRLDSSVVIRGTDSPTCPSPDSQFPVMEG